MKLREVTVKNFRNLVDVVLPIDDITVLVGENNSGKTAFLDALRIVLLRNQSSRSNPFDEYDYHMCKAGDSPQTCEGIVVELWFREDSTDEWPEPLSRALDSIIQTDPETDLDSIGLRLTSKYDEAIKDIDSRLEFLALNGQPIPIRGGNYRPLGTFLQYLRLFYLPALRDSDNEFSSRSQFWGRILRDLKISEEQRNDLRAELAKLNEDLLKADPRLEQVTTSLDKIKMIMSVGGGQNTSIQALPLQPWELMSKSQVVIKGRGSEIDFPLSRHGQGMQSLAVLFLFQAYIDVLLKPTFEQETEAILAVEEPGAHLHPQATRALAANLGEVNSQKIISTHSPYFIQEIPLKHIRMFRREGPSSNALYIRRSFTVEMPKKDELLAFCTKHAHKYSYHSTASTLSLAGKMENDEFRELLIIYPQQNDIHTRLRQLKDESKLYLSDQDLDDLENFTKRIRGEVLFARGWLLCEGQSEYLLLRYFAELLGKPLDPMGITVIDFQNNGSPGAFVGLARAFEVPWIMVCDNDAAGKNFIEQVRDRGLEDDEVKALVRALPEEGADLEEYLWNNGFAETYLSFLRKSAQSRSPKAEEWVIATDGSGGTMKKIVCDKAGKYEIRVRESSSEAVIPKPDDDMLKDVIVPVIRRDKIKNAVALINELRLAKAGKECIPEFFASAIADLVARVS